MSDNYDDPTTVNISAVPPDLLEANTALPRIILDSYLERYAHQGAIEARLVQLRTEARRVTNPRTPGQ